MQLEFNHPKSASLQCSLNLRLYISLLPCKCCGTQGPAYKLIKSYSGRVEGADGLQVGCKILALIAGYAVSFYKYAFRWLPAAYIEDHLSLPSLLEELHMCDSYGFNHINLCHYAEVWEHVNQKHNST